MLALTVPEDIQPDSEQPGLVVKQGIHLRWGFKREFGFPLHGYYLFRRTHLSGIPLCLSSVIKPLQAAFLLGKREGTPYGVISSNKNLVVTDDFAPQGTIEFDLDDRRYLRFTFPPEEPVRRIEAHIGFRGGFTGEPLITEPVDFRRLPLRFGPNPYYEQGIKFEVKDGRGNRVENTKMLTWEPDNTLVTPDKIGLRFGKEIEITLPTPASSVEVIIMHINSPAVIEAFNEDGTRAGRVGTKNPMDPETLMLTGAAIDRVIITAPAEDTYLLRLFYEGVRGQRVEVGITGLSGQIPVTKAIAKGRPGQTVIASLEADSMTAVEFDSGPAALVDLCFVPVSADARDEWELIPQFPYPMFLPIFHPNYPASGNAPEDKTRAESVALGRLKYEPRALWAGEPFAELYEQLFELVKNGRAPAMADISMEVQGTADPPDESAAAPVITQSPLDLVLLGLGKTAGHARASGPIGQVGRPARRGSSSQCRLPLIACAYSSRLRMFSSSCISVRAYFARNSSMRAGDDFTSSRM